jgi:hypothetical protein
VGEVGIEPDRARGKAFTAPMSTLERLARAFVWSVVHASLPKCRKAASGDPGGLRVL